jgi:hypothetical protein
MDPHGRIIGVVYTNRILEYKVEDKLHLGECGQKDLIPLL